MKLLNLPRWLFEWSYWRGRTPWDTSITPPEVVEFAANTRLPRTVGGAPTGRALDLGCGTGTNAITLARHGWTVTGVDFSPKAIRTARRKAAHADLEIDFRVEDVLDLQGIAGPYDFALDIGCLHSLEPRGRERYADQLAGLLGTGGRYMLYAWVDGTRRGKNRGISQETVATLFAPEFKLTQSVIGKDRGARSAWYWLTRA